MRVVKNSLEIYLNKDDEEAKKNSREKEKTKTDKWPKEDTEKFYKALQLFGTDFTILMQLLPGRSRRQIKNKFNKEEKEHPEKIDQILSKTGSYTLAEFENSYGKLNLFNKC